MKQFCALDARCHGRKDGSAGEGVSDKICPDLLFSVGSTRPAQCITDCGAKWASVSCADYAQGAQPDCVTPGTKAVGDKCAFASQCASLACSAPRMGCGVCLTGAEAGGPCNATAQCPGAQLCDGSKCQDNLHLNREGAPGAACDDTRLCNESGYCNAGTCTALSSVGGSCRPPAACRLRRLLQLDDNFQCVAPPGAGQPCFDDIGADMVCDASSYCEAGQCLALPVEGQSCSAPRIGALCAVGFLVQRNHARMPRHRFDTRLRHADWECATGSVCRDKLCQVAAPLHAACDATHVCPELATCTDAKCEPLETQGLFAMQCP